VRADPPTEAALLEILDRFCSAFAAQDVNGVIELFTPDADVVMVTSEEALLRLPRSQPFFAVMRAGRRPTPGSGKDVMSLALRALVGSSRKEPRPRRRQAAKRITRIA